MIGIQWVGLVRAMRPGGAVRGGSMLPCPDQAATELQRNGVFVFHMA